MRISNVFLFVFLMSSLWTSASAVETNSLTGFDWLLGEWIADGNGKTTKEIWKKVSANTFEGSALLIDKITGEEKTTETLRLVCMSGEKYYIAKVGHNELPIAFKLVTEDGRTSVFENKSHDFPKRIEYRLVNGDSLNVTVGGGEKNFTIMFKKLGQP
jgi:hypothetical protein